MDGKEKRKKKKKKKVCGKTARAETGERLRKKETRPQRLVFINNCIPFLKCRRLCTKIQLCCVGLGRPKKERRRTDERHKLQKDRK